jgi:hypothetical protein
MQNLLLALIFNGHLFFKLFCPIQDAIRFVECADGDEGENSSLEAEVGEGEYAYFLVLNLHK